MLSFVICEMLASSCFIEKVRVRLHERGGSSAATSFGVNLHVFNSVPVFLA